MRRHKVENYTALRRYRCGVNGCQSTLKRKEYLKNHLIHVHDFAFGQARQYVLYSERGSNNTFQEKINDFKINLLDDCCTEDSNNNSSSNNNNDIVTAEVKINSENVSHDTYSDISSTELESEKSFDIGQDPDISIDCNDEIRSNSDVNDN
jgi:hypothetical protein